MAIWKILEERYLPPYKADYGDILEKHFNIKPSRCSAMDKEQIKEVWGLVNNSKVSRSDKIVLHTTFDKCLVKKENSLEVIEAFESFKGETSLKEQADILKKLLSDKNCTAIGWNKTSINAQNWKNYDYDESKDEYKQYNHFKQNNHYWLFDELKR